MTWIRGQVKVNNTLLAGLSGLDRQLRDWEMQGIVDVNKGKITLLNLQVFQQITEGL